MKNNLSNINIVVDCDEVLTDISPLWTNEIYNKRDYFERYFKLEKHFDFLDNKDYNRVMRRDKYNLDEWLLKDNLSLTDEENKEFAKEFLKLYDNSNFYSKCIPTKMCEGVFKLATQSNVDKIYIVSKTTPKTKDSKVKFLEAYLPTNKKEIILLDQHENKSDVIKDLKNVKLIIEDCPKNILDIVENCDNLHKTDFYIPAMGYNSLTEELDNSVKDKEIALLYYDILRGEF